MKQHKEDKANNESEVQGKAKFEERPPILSRSIALSKDRKWLIFKTIRTDIVHMNYLEKVFSESKQ